jgi:NAD+ kinase
LCTQAFRFKLAHASGRVNRLLSNFPGDEGLPTMDIQNKMKIAVLGKPFGEDLVPYLQSLFDELTRREAQILIVDRFISLLEGRVKVPAGTRVFTRGDQLEGVQYVLSIGGDGTLLDAVTYVGAKEIPILGINTGRLGFLATTPYDQILPALDSLFLKDFAIDSRSLIRFDSDRDLFEGINFGLNEFTILKRDTSSMILVHTYLDGSYLNSYWADGLIVATPTGSTGYSLSCGGPVVFPQTNNFVISPVCPHNLNVRPLIVADTSVISFEIEGRSHNFLVSLDSRSKPVDGPIQIAVRKEDFAAKLVKPRHVNFLSTLRTKLHWGMDRRNSE